MEIRSRKRCVNGARGQPFVLIRFPICFICTQELPPCFHLKLPFLKGQSLSFPLMCRNKHDPVIFLPQTPPAYMLWVTDFYLCEKFEIKLEVGGAYHFDTVYYYLFQETKKRRTSRCVRERSCWRKALLFSFSNVLGTETKYSSERTQTLITLAHLYWRLSWPFLRKELRQCEWVIKAHIQAVKSTQGKHCSKKCLVPASTG